MKRTSTGCLLAVAAFWWAITGTFAGILFTTLAQHVDAQRRFRAADGTILSSRVDSHRGRKSTQYRPELRYRYAVRGKDYVGDRYTFDTSSSSDDRLAREVVAAYPAGKSATVYYDPERPESAVLSLPIPNGLWAMILFTQPFITIGLGILTALFVNPSEMRKLDRFLSTAPGVPWEIPGWGRLEERAAGWTIRPRASRVASIGAAYVLTSFLSAVVVVIAGGGFSNPPGWLVLGGYATAVSGALALGFRMAASQRSEVSFDPPSGTLAITTRKGTRRIQPGSIAALLVRRQISVVPKKGGSETRRDDPELVALLRDNETVPLNKFMATWNEDDVARKAGEELARRLGVPFRPSDAQRT